MTNLELAGYRKLLVAKLVELARAVQDREGIEIERNADELDEVQGAAEREFVIRNLDRESRLLHKVRGALARIDDSTWGVCLRCEEAINPKRLNAVPWTSYCLSCQEWADRQVEREDEYAMFENGRIPVLQHSPS